MNVWRSAPNKKVHANSETMHEMWWLVDACNVSKKCIPRQLGSWTLKGYMDIYKDLFLIQIRLGYLYAWCWHFWKIADFILCFVDLWWSWIILCSVNSIHHQKSPGFPRRFHYQSIYFFKCFYYSNVSILIIKNKWHLANEFYQRKLKSRICIIW